MILQPGLYPIDGRDLELLAALLIEWSGNRNCYDCYVNVPKYGPPILCRPLDDMALVMLRQVNLFLDLSPPRAPRSSSRPHPDRLWPWLPANTGRPAFPMSRSCSRHPMRW